MLKLLYGITIAVGLMFGPGLAKSSAGTEMNCYKIAEFAQDNTKFLPVIYELGPDDSRYLIRYYNQLRARNDMSAVEADKVIFGWGFWPDGKPDLFVVPVNQGCVVIEQAGRLSATQWQWAKRRAGVVGNGTPVILTPSVPL